MKAFVVFALIGLVAFASSAPTEETPAVPSPYVPKCPKHDSHRLTLLANPDNCRMYYTCDRGLAVPMHCPADLHFNDAQKACDWPENACCDLSLDKNHRC